MIKKEDLDEIEQLLSSKMKKYDSTISQLKQIIATLQREQNRTSRQLANVKHENDQLKIELRHALELLKRHM